jgi:hypothetical protein
LAPLRREKGVRMKKALILTAVVVLSGFGLVACGGDDDDDETTTGVPGAAQAAALQDEIAGLSDEEQITRVGAAWADPFAAGDQEACAYFHPDIVPAVASCLPILEGAFTRSLRRQESFKGATVVDVTVKGETASAVFSNGEPVEFQKDPEGAWKIIAVQ